MIKGITVLKDVVKVEEVSRVLEVLESIGVEFSWVNKTTLKIDTSSGIKIDKIDQKSAGKTRISVLLLGALATQFKKFKLPHTAGCKLGKRSLRPHFYALERLGIKVKQMEGHYDVTNKDIKGNDVVMYESGDTTTENVIMAAVLAKGKTIIKFASANYMVQDLCAFLIQAGAKIKGIGTTTLEIEGVEKLNEVEEFFISPDPIDAMAFITLGVVNKAKLRINNCSLLFLELELEKLRMMGQKFKIVNKKMSKNGFLPIGDVVLYPSKLHALSDKIYGRPYPGLNIDNLPFFAPIALIAKGQTLIHDWPYENRAIYNLEFQKLGGKVILLDPHRVIMEGSGELKGAEVVAPDAIRPAMSILIAMTFAKGKSILRNVYPIERAYSDLESRLRSVGVNIKYEK